MHESLSLHQLGAQSYYHTALTRAVCDKCSLCTRIHLIYTVYGLTFAGLNFCRSRGFAVFVFLQLWLQSLKEEKRSLLCKFRGVKLSQMVADPK